MRFLTGLAQSRLDTVPGHIVNNTQFGVLGDYPLGARADLIHPAVSAWYFLRSPPIPDRFPDVGLPAQYAREGLRTPYDRGLRPSFCASLCAVPGRTRRRDAALIQVIGDCPWRFKIRISLVYLTDNFRLFFVNDEALLRVWVIRIDWDAIVTVCLPASRETGHMALAKSAPCAEDDLFNVLR